MSEGFQQLRSQVEMMDMVYMRMVEQCRKKCIPSSAYKDTELNKGESVCIDRCASKYFFLFEHISQNLAQKTTDSA